MNHIAVIDFGSQYTHLITRRIRELNVLAEIYPPDVPIATLAPDDVTGIILSGGPQSVYDEQSLRIDPDVFLLGKPTLGICYGHQLMAATLGGEVEAGLIREYGRAQLTHQGTSALLAGIHSPTTVWMSHGDSVTRLPQGFTAVAATDDCPVAAMANEDRGLYGIQFHPEVHHTTEGTALLANFVLRICRAKPEWLIEDLLAQLITGIREKVGDKNVFVLVSGGVDSSVAFALLTRALGEERVRGLYIDTGFMRKNESAEIQQGFIDAGFRNFETHDAHKLFYQRLAGATEPEEKRHIIGQAFIDVKDEIAAKLGLSSDQWLLGQGTIYPDTIETGGTKNADVIKTHHNRVNAIQELIAAGKVIEPLAEFYKDEVRQIGRLLGLPAPLVDRQPFPGPGLAIRLLCQAETKEAVHTVVPAEQETLAALCTTAGSSWQVLPVRSVGVQGDNRTYAHPVALWGLEAWNELDQLATKITNSLHAINRAVWWLNPTTASDLASATLFARTLTPERTALLQELDAIVQVQIRAAGLEGGLWQVPVILLPFGNGGKESVVIRPTVSQEAMTAHFAPLPLPLVQSITQALLATGAVSFVFYDVTNKPPGTIEWE